MPVQGFFLFAFVLGLQLQGLRNMYVHEICICFFVRVLRVIRLSQFCRELRVIASEVEVISKCECAISLLVVNRNRMQFPIATTSRSKAETTWHWWRSRAHDVIVNMSITGVTREWGECGGGEWLDWGGFLIQWFRRKVCDESLAFDHAMYRTCSVYDFPLVSTQPSPCTCTFVWWVTVWTFRIFVSQVLEDKQ